MNLNKLYLVGTLKQDPETRETHSGSSVTRIVVIVFREYFSKERNQRVREQDSFEVQYWGGLGLEVAKQFKRGSQIFVEGRLKQDTWETPTGEKRQRTVVHGENFAAVGATAAAVAAVTSAVGPDGAPATGEEGPTPTTLPPGGSGKRKRRRRRGGGPRPGLPAGPVVPQTPEERAAFAAGITTPPATGEGAPAATPPPAEATSAPPPPKVDSAPLPPPPPPAPKPAPEPPKANVSLKEDMPF